MSRLAGWLRVALVDLSGISRFGVLIACLALGVGTIAAVGSVGAMLEAAIARDARLFLGGDMEAQLTMRPANPEERDFLEDLGQVAALTEINSRANASHAGAFVNLRAVDESYPLVGTVELKPRPAAGQPLPELLALRNGRWGAVVDSLLLERLDIGLGESFRIGQAELEVRAVLEALPDQAAQGFQLGIPVIVSDEALQASGLIQPGVLARHRYKLLLAGDFEAGKAAIEQRFPGQGWELRSPEDATSDLAEFFGLFSRFLTLVGLSSLLVGGVGVTNAVSAYITDRQRAIATMRSLGATGTRVLFHFLVQIGVLSLTGIAFGLGLGSAASLVALPILGDLLAIGLDPALHLPSLLNAALFGALIAFVFAYLPLRRAQKLRPASLFRTVGAGVVEGSLTWRDLLSPKIVVPLLVTGAALFLLAIATTGEIWLVLWYGLGALAAFMLLRVAALVLQLLLRLLPSFPDARLRNALKAIYRPGAPAPAIMLSLGLGLALLLMIAQVDSTLRGQLRGQISDDAPSFVMINMQKPQMETLAALAEDETLVEEFAATAMLRGIVTSIRGIPVAQLGPLPEEVARMFEGDTSLTWSRELPTGSEITEGAWWPEDYSGEPLISLSQALEEPLELGIGDEMVITVLGRPITAKIASFRRFEWRGRGFNFMLVLSPGLIESAPATYMGTLKAAEGRTDELQSRLVDDFPDLSFIPVGDALDRIDAILANLANAVAIVGGVAVLGGVLVLAGAMATGRRQREADAVVMKVLGASRADVIAAYLFEYGLLGAVAALLASLLGTLGAWAIAHYVLELSFAIDPMLIVLVLAGAIGLTIVTGIATTWSSFSVRPARYLRSQ